MSDGDLLRRAVGVAPDRAAIVEGVPSAVRRRWTYAELLRDAEACTRALLARYTPGDQVGDLGAEHPAWPVRASRTHWRGIAT